MRNWLKKAFRPLRSRDTRMAIPIHWQYDKTAPPIGYVVIDEKFQGQHLGRMVIAPGGRAEHDEIVEVLEFGLIPSQTFNVHRDAVPIHGVGPEDSRPVVGYVRMSESMTFTLGAPKDLDLHPIARDEKVIGYEIVPFEDPVRRLRDLAPGPYIFRFEDGRVVNLEAIPAKHVVEIRENGYSLQHPYECRAGGKSLHDCELWHRVQKADEDLRRLARNSSPARYFCTWDEETKRLVLENIEHSKAEAGAEEMHE